MSVDLLPGVAVRRMPSSDYAAAYSPSLRRFFWISVEAFEFRESDRTVLASDLDVDTLEQLRLIGLTNE